MSWRAAAKKDTPAILRFLIREEARCVPFTSRIRGGTRGCEIFFDADEGGIVTDCALFTVGGLLLPVFSVPPAHRGELARLLSRLRPAVHSITGVSRSVEEAEALVPIPPTRRIEYFLLALEKDNARRLWTPPAGPDMRVRRAGPADAKALLPLQEAYEKEEVLIDPAHFNAGQCMKSLALSLREEILYVLERGGRPVAKAGTNARGFGVDQIGGVYTLPADRGKGFARIVMVALLREVFREKSGACLFVKKKNRPAIQLYNGLGFQPLDEYAISYYGL
jgi:predicted GNAT family acetyltransferase